LKTPSKSQPSYFSPLRLPSPSFFQMMATLRSHVSTVMLPNDCVSIEDIGGNTTVFGAISNHITSGANIGLYNRCDTSTSSTSLQVTLAHSYILLARCPIFHSLFASLSSSLSSPPSLQTTETSTTSLIPLIDLSALIPPPLHPLLPLLLDYIYCGSRAINAESVRSRIEQYIQQKNSHSLPASYKSTTTTATSTTTSSDTATPRSPFPWRTDPFLSRLYVATLQEVET